MRVRRGPATVTGERTPHNEGHCPRTCADGKAGASADPGARTLRAATARSDTGCRRLRGEDPEEG
ncbi:hypothetical protein GCM10027271_28490 [Saccharopolyspora gloriosae]